MHGHRGSPSRKTRRRALSRAPKFLVYRKSPPFENRLRKTSIPPSHAALALGSFKSEGEEPLSCAVELRKWHKTYSLTMKPSYRVLADRVIENHLVPYFGDHDLRQIRESDLLDYIRVKMAKGLVPKTIKNHLSILRRVFNLLAREEVVSRNPVSRLGELMRKVGDAAATQTEEVEHWSREEIEKLIATARETEPRFAPFLVLLFSTGMRRGEALGLQWGDVDFEGGLLTIRRAIVKEGVTTPKSGKARKVRMTPALVEELFGVLGERRREVLSRGWRDTPIWVFCSEAGTMPEPRNLERVWLRVRRRAHKQGVRPLKLHCTRHTWATMALQAGKSVRWVADALGHADPALTLRVYAHAMADEERDLSFAEFDDPRRPYTAPLLEERTAELANYAKSLARREGFEPPTPRFEAKWSAGGCS